MELAGVFGDAKCSEGIGAYWGSSADTVYEHVAGNPAVVLKWQVELAAAGDVANVGEHEGTGAGPEREESADATGDVL